jgi:sulfate adenylyltransferase subunit 1
MTQENIQDSLLRFMTCGSVDDGKSTLIGRLLFDTKTILTDTLTQIEKTSKKRGMTAVDLSLITDGLQAEREQGITIDVALDTLVQVHVNILLRMLQAMNNTLAIW